MLNLNLNSALLQHLGEERTRTPSPHPEEWLYCKKSKTKLHSIPQSHDPNFYKAGFYITVFILFASSIRSTDYNRSLSCLLKFLKATESSIIWEIQWRFHAGVTQQDVLTEARTCLSSSAVLGIGSIGRETPQYLSTFARIFQNIIWWAMNFSEEPKRTAIDFSVSYFN